MAGVGADPRRLDQARLDAALALLLAAVAILPLWLVPSSAGGREPDLLANVLALAMTFVGAGMFAWLPKGVDPAKLASKTDIKAALKGLGGEELADLRRKADNAVRMIECEKYVNPKACLGTLQLKAVPR